MNVEIAKLGILVNLVSTTTLLVQRGRNAPAATACHGRAVYAARTALDCSSPKTRITGVLETIKPPRNGGLEFKFLRNKGMYDDHQEKREARKPMRRLISADIMTAVRTTTLW